jgi:hypothetical protein
MCLEQVLGDGRCFRPILSARRVISFDVTLVDDHPRFIDGHPLSNSIIERSIHRFRVIGKPTD